jgi:hypothetical protein
MMAYTLKKVMLMRANIKIDYKTSLAENGEFSFNKILCIYHNFI